MGKIVISTNVSLDGVVQDPDGQEGFRLGGWFARSGGEDLDQWRQGMFEETLRIKALLLGRRSEEWFGSRWTQRTDEWAKALNAVPKYVISAGARRTPLDELDDPARRRGQGGLEAQAGDRRHHRRLRQLPARPPAARGGPGRRGAPFRLPGRARERRACLRRRPPPPTPCAWSRPRPSERTSFTSATRWYAPPDHWAFVTHDAS